jgi:hypothetical protein
MTKKFGSLSEKVRKTVDSLGGNGILGLREAIDSLGGTLGGPSLKSEVEFLGLNRNQEDNHKSKLTYKKPELTTYKKD